MTNPLSAPRTKAADLLLRAQLLQKPQYERVVALVQQSNDRAEEVLLENDLMNEADLLKALSGIYRTHFVSTEKLSKADIPKATIQLIPKRVAETLGVFPVLFDPKRNALSVVTADPDNADLLREVKLVSGAHEVKAFVARPAAVSAAIRKHHGGDARAFDMLDRTGLSYDWGQTVSVDGRVATRQKGSDPDLGLSFGGSMAPPPSPRENALLTAPSMMPKPLGRGPSAQEEEDLMRQVRGLPFTEERGTLRHGSVPVAGLSAPPPPPPTSGAPPPMPRPRSAPRLALAEGRQSMVPPSRPRGAGGNPQSPEAARLATFTSDTTIELLTVLVSLLENSRQELRGHSSQVARLLKRVAERMKLERADAAAVVVAGHIHDLGKMGQFHLTAYNCSEYEGHRVAAQKAYDTPSRLLEAVRLPTAIKNAVFHMYERFDGKGFPDKLVGKEIPLGARLLSVADAYADLTQNPRNPFRKVLGPAEAMGVLMKHKGTIFDPGILDLFQSLVLGEDMRAKLLANRYSVLLIDPDPEESTVLELRMVEQGFEVRTVRNSDAAVKALTADGADFDVVVCEVELPGGIDGLTFLQQAREEPWGREMPWVFHTHKQGRTEAQRAFELGAIDFVAKPVQADVLVAKLKAMLDQRATKSGSKGVSGSLKEMGLPDIVQILFHGRKTGKLNVRSGGKAGEIHFLEGNIANAVHGDLAGTDAFYAMLKFSDGDFALDPSFRPARRVVTESSEALLLEGMRRLDEGV